jgi:hypothetical protein
MSSDILSFYLLLLSDQMLVVHANASKKQALVTSVLMLLS